MMNNQDTTLANTIATNTTTGQNQGSYAYSAKQENKNQATAFNAPGEKEREFYRNGGVIRGELYPDTTVGVYKSDVTGAIAVSVRLKNPVDGQYVVLHNVTLANTNTTGIKRINPNSSLMVTVPDYKQLNTQTSAGIIASVVDTKMDATNTSVPIRNLRSNSRTNAIGGDTKRLNCRLGSFDLSSAQTNLHTNQSMNVVADPENKSSAGVLFDHTNQETILFNQQKQNMSLGRKGVEVQAQRFQQNNSTAYKDNQLWGGLNAGHNQMEEMYPRSNILLNIPLIMPSSIPDFPAIIGGLAVIYKMIRLGTTAAAIIEDRDNNYKRCKAELKSKRKQLQHQSKLGNNQWSLGDLNAKAQEVTEKGVASSVTKERERLKNEGI